MIQQKKATDAEIYKRYQHVDPDHPMYEYKCWFERGKKPKYQGTDAHWKAREIVIELSKKMKQKDICEVYGLYPSFIHRLKHKDFRKVPEERCKQLIKTIED